MLGGGRWRQREPCRKLKLRDPERAEKVCPFILFFSAVMLLAFFLFTFAPPDIGLFAEP